MLVLFDGWTMTFYFLGGAISQGPPSVFFVMNSTDSQFIPGKYGRAIGVNLADGVQCVLGRTPQFNKISFIL